MKLVETRDRRSAANEHEVKRGSSSSETAPNWRSGRGRSCNDKASFVPGYFSSSSATNEDFVEQSTRRETCDEGISSYKSPRCYVTRSGTRLCYKVASVSRFHVEHALTSHPSTSRSQGFRGTRITTWRNRLSEDLPLETTVTAPGFSKSKEPAVGFSKLKEKNRLSWEPIEIHEDWEIARWKFRDEAEYRIYDLVFLLFSMLRHLPANLRNRWIGTILLVAKYG